MVNINKVYTRTGDDGDTGLLGDERLAKSAPRIEALGTVDELNCHMGKIFTDVPKGHNLRAKITRIQNDLFNLGASIALHHHATQNSPNIIDKDVTTLEQEIDHMNNQLEPLTSFILPQGSAAIAQIHITRSVCRRAERRMVELHQTESLNAPLLQYINRLSDWLFVLARYVGHVLKHKETLWQPNTGAHANEKK
jgi:cob(I)alamin adenosyltransferase